MEVLIKRKQTTKSKLPSVEHELLNAMNNKSLRLRSGASKEKVKVTEEEIAIARITV